MGKGKKRIRKTPTNPPVSNTYTLGEVFYGGSLGVYDKEFSVIGLGMARMTSNKDGTGHERKIDINPEAVKKSFGEFKEDFANSLYKSISAFYKNDANKYQNVINNGGQKRKPRKFTALSRNCVTFDINVIPSRLSSTTFTYIYQFDLSFHDQDYNINIVDNLKNLKQSLVTLKNDIIDLFNQYIPKEYQRDKSELDFQHADDLCRRYDTDNIQKIAPVISATKGKFEMSQVDLSQVAEHLLFKRAKRKSQSENTDEFDQVVLDHYCEGKSDAEIALHDFIRPSLKKHLGRSILKGVAAIATAIIYGPTPYAAQINSGISLATGKDILGHIGDFIGRITGKNSIAKHFQTGTLFDGDYGRERWWKSLSELNNQFVITEADIITFFTSKVANSAIGCGGAIAQAAQYHATQLKVELDSLDVPKAMDELLPIELILPDSICKAILQEDYTTDLEKEGIVQFGKVRKASHTTNPVEVKDHKHRSWAAHIDDDTDNNMNKNKSKNKKQKKR